jgi:hypothetical protein
MRKIPKSAWRGIILSVIIYLLLGAAGVLFYSDMATSRMEILT